MLFEFVDFILKNVMVIQLFVATPIGLAWFNFQNNGDIIPEKVFQVAFTVIECIVVLYYIILLVISVIVFLK